MRTVNMLDTVFEDQLIPPPLSLLEILANRKTLHHDVIRKTNTASVSMFALSSQHTDKNKYSGNKLYKLQFQ